MSASVIPVLGRVLVRLKSTCLLRMALARQRPVVTVLRSGGDDRRGRAPHGRGNALPSRACLLFFVNKSQSKSATAWAVVRSWALLLPRSGQILSNLRCTRCAETTPTALRSADSRGHFPFQVLAVTLINFCSACNPLSATRPRPWLCRSNASRSVSLPYCRY